MCSRTVATMSGDSVKAFLYLLCEAWLQEPRATLPKSDAELASMARLPLEKWREIKNDAIRAFKFDKKTQRLYSELQLETSNKFYKNQRFNNKNAIRTRSERDRDA